MLLCGKYRFGLGEKGYVMGILNVTPDSFSDGGDYVDPDLAVQRAIEIQNLGADIVDIGAQSTKPGAVQISVDEELRRLLPVLSGLKGKLHIPISVDTFYPKVAAKALEFGADIINDVTGFKDEEMFNVVRGSDCGIVIMHDFGEPNTIVPFFAQRIEKAEKIGINPSRICFDIGIGFGKSYEENLFILANLPKFRLNNNALLVGVSRKRVIGYSCGNPPFKERLPGTIAANSIALFDGADIVRVHDVAEAVQATQVACKIRQYRKGQV